MTLIYGFCLPDNYRKEFKFPRGIVLSNKPQSNIQYLRRIIDEKTRLIAIGDYVTYNLIFAGIRPSIAVIDYKTLRSERIELNFRKYFKKVVRVINPPGMISSNAIKIIENVDDDTLVEVVGEEDMLLLPFILSEKYIGYILVYGQPGRGMVIVESNTMTRKTAINFWILLKPCIKQEN